MNAYLSSHRSKDKSECTHTRIGNTDLGIYGGSYHIPDDSDFLPLYFNHVANNNEYLTEKQHDCGPLAIDIDLRYSIAKRAYTESHIISFVDSLLDNLHTVFHIKETFPIYVFEKPNINVLDSGKIKDGLHLIAGLNINSQSKSLIRSRLLTKMDSIWTNMNIINDWENVLDDGVFKGKTGWQLYGSRKPGNEAYELTQVMSCIHDASTGQFEIHSLPGKIFPKESYAKLSIRNLNNETPIIRDEFIQVVEQAKQRSRLRIIPTTTVPSSNDITSPLLLTRALEKLFSGLEVTEYIVQETHEYIMCLPSKYYTDYDKWIKVGMALRNTDDRLFLSWVKFSSQWSEFSFDSIDELNRHWIGFEHSKPEDDAVLTVRSIMFWARTENDEEYQLVKDRSINVTLEETIKDVCTEYDIATLLYQCYKDQFICASIQGGIWYQYKKHRWNETDSGTELRGKLTHHKGLYGLYARKLSDVNYQLSTMSIDDARHPVLKKKSDKIYKVMTGILKKQGDKIMRESCHLFYVNKFIINLDMNTNLLCCSNGIVDFSTNTFREGVPEDYTQKCTHIPYAHSSTLSKKLVNEVTTFMDQLFPDKELCEYMWEHASSVLVGANKNQSFNIYIGCGRNGKSKFVELMSLMLGDYTATVPVSLITKPRVNIGGVSPEVAGLVGVRYAVMQESSVNDRINEGMMKELTGGDKVQCRALYKDTFAYKPQFKLVMPTNNLPEMVSKDNGSWRRIKACEFKTEFNENPDSTNKYEVLVDKNLDSKFGSWKSVFLSLLVDRAYKNNGTVLDCDMVTKPSEKYRNDQDFYYSFHQECIVIVQGEVIKEALLIERFTTWWKHNQTKSAPRGKELYEYFNKLYAKHKLVTKKNHTWINLGFKVEDEVEACDGI